MKKDFDNVLTAIIKRYNVIVQVQAYIYLLMYVILLLVCQSVCLSVCLRAGLITRL